MTHKKQTHILPAMRAVLLAGVVSICFLLSLTSLSSTAGAATVRQYQSSFGSFPAGGPSNVAVDQSNGDVYVAHSDDSGRSELSVSRYDASGAPKNFTAGPNAGTNTLLSFQSGGSFATAAIAVDNSNGPLAGDVYVIDTDTAEPDSVKVFSPSGTSLGAIYGVVTNNGHWRAGMLCGLAVDHASGALYISETNSESSESPFGPGHVYRFAPSSPSGELSDEDFKVTGIVAENACDLAVDSGRVYVQRGGGGESGGTLYMYSAADFSSNFSTQVAGTEFDSGKPNFGVAVDSKTGEVYANEGRQIAVFDSVGNALYRFGASAYFGTAAMGVAVKSAASGPATKVYVGDHQVDHQVDVFGAPTQVPSLTHREVAAFGPDGTTATQFGSNSPFGLAFDQAQRRLFALDSGGPSIYGFDAAAPPIYAALTGFDPLGTPTVSAMAVDNSGLGSTGNVYAISPRPSQIYGWSSAGTPLGGAFPISPATNPGSSDGSPAALCGAAVDSTGNIWVANGGTGHVLKYSPSGSYLGSVPAYVDTVEKITVDATEGNFKLFYPVGSAGAPHTADLPFNSTASQVENAVNGLSSISSAGGHVSVSLTGNTYSLTFEGSFTGKYDNIGVETGGTPLGGGKGIGTTLTQGGSACSIALDANGDLYAEIPANGVFKYTASSGYTSSNRVAAGEPGVAGLAIDPVTHRLYVARVANIIDEYDQSGTLIDEFALNGSANPRALAVDGTSHDLYVADTEFGRHRVRAVGPGVIFPEASVRPATALGNALATLNGSLSDQGVELTDCHFEFVTEAAFKVAGFTDLSSGGSVPCAPAAGTISLDLEEHLVSAAVTGLARDADYRYRLVATNANGSVASGNLSFSTTGPPRVETTGTPLRGATTAQLLGRVDPVRESTTYHFEYGSQGPCDSAPCAVTESQLAGSGNEFELVAQAVDGLVPNVTYHYRLVAENGNPDGAAYGQDMTVTTRASDASLSHGHYPGPPGSDRAYEQVSLPDAGGNPVLGPKAISDNGDRATYMVFGGTPISDAGSLESVYFAERDPQPHPTRGWQTRLITPPRAQVLSPSWSIASTTGDLSSILATNGGGFFGGGSASQSVAYWRLSPEGSPSKLFEAVAEQHPSTAGIEELPGGARVAIFLQGGSADPTFPAAAAHLNLYDVATGTPRLLSLLPGDTVAGCGLATGVGGSPKAAYVDDTSAFFSTSGSECAAPPQLYARDLGTGQTRLVSGPPISGSTCQATLIRVAGGAAFFWTASRLVPADNVPSSCSSSGDVYRYGIADESLQCVTCVAGKPADVVSDDTQPSREIAVAEDGSRAYFTSASHLLPGAPPQGQNGIYRVEVDSGALSYVSAPGVRIGPGPGGSSISVDGSLLLFASKSSAINTVGGTTNAGTTQIYLYDDNDRSLVCVSCPPNGSAPVGNATNPILATEHGNVSFSTPMPLLAGDQNTAPAGSQPATGTDVYEWRNGRLLLVTDGLSQWRPSGGPSPVAITPSGRDLFINVEARYTPDALDSFARAYDARIGGGIDFPEAPRPCPLEVCQGSPHGAPEEQVPGTGSFSGVGNAKSTANKRNRRHHRRRHRKHAAKRHKATARTERATR